ncbi:MAG: LysR family transcriptional regulator [Planctomycetes bacterium]|nr:LysR family transcriptional regulator [Planctomycetota bacterium]
MPRIQRGPRKHTSRSDGEGPPGVWEGRLRLWVAVDGHNALGPGKMRLLESIASTKSLSAAAKRHRMSYRLAWKHLRDIEERTGLTVVEPRRGGASGGGTDLTEEGLALLAAYREFHREIEEHMRSACHRYFSTWSARSVAKRPVGLNQPVDPAADADAGPDEDE